MRRVNSVGSGKKFILIFLDLIFGLYFVNSKLLFFSSLSGLSLLHEWIVFFGGILIFFNIFYLLFFQRRIRLA